MPAYFEYSDAPPALVHSRIATYVIAATRAQATAHILRTRAEQNIIEGECRATKLALTEDREAWRVYQRKRGNSATPFIPYLT